LFGFYHGGNPGKCVSESDWWAGWNGGWKTKKGSCNRFRHCDQTSFHSATEIGWEGSCIWWLGGCCPGDATRIQSKADKIEYYDAGTNATAKEANERAPDEKVDYVKATAPELNPKPTKSGENDAATEAPVAEANATASDEGASPVMATAAELNPNPTKPTAKDAVTDATSWKSKGRGQDPIPLDGRYD
jgi:hypothetical protein